MWVLKSSRKQLGTTFRIRNQQLFRNHQFRNYGFDLSETAPSPWLFFVWCDSSSYSSDARKKWPISILFVEKPNKQDLALEKGATTLEKSMILTDFLIPHNYICNSKILKFSFFQCYGSGMFISDPGLEFSILDPGFRVKKILDLGSGSKNQRI